MKPTPGPDKQSGRPRPGVGPRVAEPPIFITVTEFAAMARLSRRQLDRLRKKRGSNFPTEYELGSGMSKYRRCPRFKLSEVQDWLDSRALW